MTSATDRVPTALIEAATTAYYKSAGAPASPMALVEALAAALSVDRTKVTCGKCGGSDVHTRWVAAETECWKGCCKAKPEHFARFCRGCGYKWVTHDVLTLDGPK